MPTAITATTAVTGATEATTIGTGAGASASARSSAAPSRHRRALITWLAVYPTITLALTVLGSATASLPLPVRTLILTVAVVPVVAYLLIPALLRLDTTLTSHRPAAQRHVP